MYFVRGTQINDDYYYYNSKLEIYLMKYTLCHIQYIGKSETQFNLRLNHHPKDVNKQNAPLVDQHFKLPGHNFNQT